MGKDKFIMQYVINYLASYAANAVVNNQTSVDSNRSLVDNPPVDDAHKLAEGAWAAYYKYRRDRDLYV